MKVSAVEDQSKILIKQKGKIMSVRYKAMDTFNLIVQGLAFSGMEVMEDNA